MARVTFTQNLQRHIVCPPCDVRADSVRDALGAAFERYPGLRGYVLDDQGAVRKHITVFVNGAPIRDRAGQCDALAASDEVYVMQALSGG